MIHRLRLIHLYECDLNFILGCKWREAIHKAQYKKTEQINEGQYRTADVQVENQ